MFIYGSFQVRLLLSLARFLCFLLYPRARTLRAYIFQYYIISYIFAQAHTRKRYKMFTKKNEKRGTARFSPKAREKECGNKVPKMRRTRVTFSCVLWEVSHPITYGQERSRSARQNGFGSRFERMSVRAWRCFHLCYAHVMLAQVFHILLFRILRENGSLSAAVFWVVENFFGVHNRSTIFCTPASTVKRYQKPHYQAEKSTFPQFPQPLLLLLLLTLYPICILSFLSGKSLSRRAFAESLFRSLQKMEIGDKWQPLSSVCTRRMMFRSEKENGALVVLHFRNDIPDMLFPRFW